MTNYELTGEGKQIAEHGSYEYRLYEAIGASGLSQDEASVSLLR